LRWPRSRCAASTCCQASRAASGASSSPPRTATAFLGIPPTGHRVSTQHIHIYRVEDDMVAEHRACRDDIGGLRQLGIQPGPS
jgi:predicted ester cyclase